MGRQDRQHGLVDKTRNARISCSTEHAPRSMAALRTALRIVLPGVGVATPVDLERRLVTCKSTPPLTPSSVALLFSLTLTNFPYPSFGLTTLACLL
jgi:hypothetical protein